MNKYELMFVVNVADEEKIKAAVQLVQDVIKKIGGTVDKVDEWGKRALAYEVKKQREGYYVVAFALLLNFISQSALTPFINLVYSATNLLNDILYQLNCCFNLFFISNVHNKHEFILIHS